VSYRNEIIVSKHLINVISELLKGYETSYEEDTLLLKNPEDLSPYGIEAVKLRREEKGMLLEAREMVKTKWIKLLEDPLFE
jgi:hypothetical protein